MANQTTGLTVQDITPCALPPVLFEIQPQDSSWPSKGTHFITFLSQQLMWSPLPVFDLLKHTITFNPLFLGNPEHVHLCNSSGSITHRKVKTPPFGTASPDKWYAVTCGTTVGIFLSW